MYINIYTSTNVYTHICIHVFYTTFLGILSTTDLSSSFCACRSAIRWYASMSSSLFSAAEMSVVPLGVVA